MAAPTEATIMLQYTHDDHEWCSCTRKWEKQAEEEIETLSEQERRRLDSSEKVPP